MSSAFDLATAVRRARPGAWSVDVHAEWSIGGRTNGGYVLALIARAALAELGVGEMVPLAATAAFLAPAPPGPATVDVAILRKGRTSMLRARLSADGPCVETLITMGALPHGAALKQPSQPPMPAEDDCPRLPPRTPFGTEVPLLTVLAERLDPACLAWATGAPSGAGELRGWVRFDDGRAFDPLALLLAVDCLPPPTFDVSGLIPGWVPTLQLSAYVRGVPGPGPLLVRTRARSVVAGAVDETCDVWDADGRLVAVGHQLALVRTA